MKISFGTIVFQSDHVLKQALEAVYPFAHQILIAEGPVGFWQQQGYTSSTDKTNDILHFFPDPEKKIKITHGQFKEKDEQCKAYMQFLDSKTDYLINLDADEVYKQKDLENLIDYLKKEKPTSVGVRSISFFGGVNDYITGFEQQTDNFLRIFKVEPGCDWLTHRPPTIKYPREIQKKHVTSDQLYKDIGLNMYHYSYTFSSQVKMKMKYYESKVAIGKIIPNYYENLYLPWARGNDRTRKSIEMMYGGVHEFGYQFRGPAYTKKFEGEHPEPIQKVLGDIKKRIEKELEE